MGTLSSSEKGGESFAPNIQKRVTQPKLQIEVSQLLETLETIESLGNRIAETAGEDRSASGDGAMVRGDGTTQASPRDIAIAALPAPVVMQQQLAKHIRKEVKKLNREAKQTSRLAKPGAAFYLNELYARIRRLNALLHELLNASVEVLKRLFIRVFIDKQQII